MPSRQLFRLRHRLGLYLDIAALRLRMRFRELQRQFYVELWQTAARNLGAEFIREDAEYFRLRRDGLTTFVNLSRVMLDDHVTLNIMGNKALTYKLLAEKGCPVPRYCTYSPAGISAAAAFMAKLGGPVVVKPAAGTGGGRGVTTGISGEKELLRATRIAARYGERILVEEQLAGASYRLLYLDGRFIDAVRRDPPTIIGDGRHTIRRLIGAENEWRLTQRPFTSMNPLLIDRDCRLRLHAQGLHPHSRPAKGLTIRVKHAANENSSRDNHSVRDKVNPEMIESGSRLVASLGVKLAGVDVICEDISLPPSQSGGRINEINTTPALHHHYLLAEPDKVVPVAEILLKHMFENRQGVMVL